MAVRPIHLELDRDRFESLLSILPWPVLVLSDHGDVFYASERDASPGAHGNKIDPAAFDALLRERLGALEGESPWLAAQEVKLTRFTPQGQTVHEMLTVRPTPAGNFIFVMDVTEQHARQVSDLQTTRLAALGFMMAGVSHEISNPLASIHSVVQLMKSDADRDPALIELGLDNIEFNVKRILEISRRLVTFCRVGEEPRTAFAIHRVVEESVSSLRQHDIYAAVRFEVANDPEALVLAHPGQIREVVVNLLTNAAQAMGGRGQVVVTTTLLESHVRISVTDEGPGIPVAIREKIFEPFFTTKASGQGTGLGLAVSRQIVREQGGRLWVDEASGRGATFHLELPRPRP